MAQATSTKHTSKQDTEPFATERTVGYNPEIQKALDEIYAGADASAAKDYLDKYIWIKMWNHIRRLATCEPTLEQLLTNRESLKACLEMAHDLNLRMSSARVASERLRELYKVNKI